MFLRRGFTVINLPWNFANKPKRLPKETIADQTNVFMQQYVEGFEEVYKQILLGISTHDFELLEHVCEPRLFSAFRAGLLSVVNERMNLKIYNEDQPVSLSFYNDIVIKGAHIEREKNPTNLEIRKAQDLTKEDGGSVIDYISQKQAENYIDWSKIRIVEGAPDYKNFLLLRMDIEFESACKMALYTNDNEILDGETNNGIETHTLRFEIQHEDAASFFTNLWSYKNITQLDSRKMEEIFGDSQWTLVDVDHFLKGNLLKA